MKHLLDKWATLESHLCKRETRPNKDWHEEFEDYKLLSPDGNQIYLVYSDSHPEGWMPDKERAMVKIQWAIQKSIVEKGWYLLILYNHEHYAVEMGPKQPSPRFTKGGKNLAECLLVAYLAELEASANP